MENEILKLYFEDGLRPVDIAEKLNIPSYKITRVLQKDTKKKIKSTFGSKCLNN